ncbi:maleylpyruvate isomerase N-terminal domain-containing protein [Micromonospora carbonacea]|uniref:maleylpyruvate isomerase N-terminal domain-containing protein n=1 Tax=Micromonospora carbonacea TaxID=47853 RepID=UPI003317A13F
MTAVSQPEALAQAYAGLTDVVAPLDDAGLRRPTRCRGWRVADLLFHVLCDAQRALVALASPADGPADRDDVSYWRGFAAAADATGAGTSRRAARDDGDSGDRHAGWVRRSVAAFEHPSGVFSGSGPTLRRPPSAPPPPPTRTASSPRRATCCGCRTCWPRSPPRRSCTTST